jgi:hypothetical protein
MANNPQLSGLRLKVKIIKRSGYGLVCCFGVRSVGAVTVAELGALASGTRHRASGTHP